MRHRTNNWLRGLFAFAMTWLMIGAPASAHAESFSALESVLRGIKWGDKKKEVLEKVESQMYADLLKKPELANAPVKMQQARKGVRDTFAKVRKSAIKFKGSKTGYEVSIIANEFTTNNNEEMFVVRDDFAERYYFFIDGLLYKLVIAYNKKYVEGSDFESFAVQMARKYGRPVSTDYGDVLGEEELVEVTWRSSATEMRIFNKRELYSTYSVSFADLGKIRKIKASGRKCCGFKKKDNRREAALSKEVSALTTEDASKGNQNAVTDLVGDVEIDFSLGQPKDEPLRPSEKKKIEAKKKKSKNKKRRRRRRRRRKKGGLKKKKGSKALVIY